MSINIDILMNEYMNQKEQLKEYNSYINHVREYKGYVFKEFKEVN